MQRPSRLRSINEITGAVVDSAMRVHTALGPGLLESAYEACLVHELAKKGLRVKRQQSLPVHYDGLAIDAGYRIDLVVEDLVRHGIKRMLNKETFPSENL